MMVKQLGNIERSYESFLELPVPVVLALLATMEKRRFEQDTSKE